MKVFQASEIQDKLKCDDKSKETQNLPQEQSPGGAELLCLLVLAMTTSAKRRLSDEVTGYARI